MSDPATEMREAWERFAREDPMFYIHSGRKDWDSKGFFESGAVFPERAVAWLGESAPRRRLLEVGCGIGRMTVHFAKHFERVDAVDVSSAMIEQARSLDPPANVRFHVVSGSDLASFDDGVFDAAASSGVFQHIPEEAVVERYVSEIARVLAPAGQAVLHFDSRAPGLLRRAALRLPDVALPRANRRHIRRYPRSVELLHEMFRRSGLVLEGEVEAGTEGHTVLLRKSGERSP